MSQRNKNLANILRSSSLNLPDGMPSVWIGKLKGSKRIERCYGQDFFSEVISWSANLPIKHFFCGGKEGVPKELKIACENKFNNRNCVGTFSPPFREMTHGEFVSLAEAINASGAHVVWIGMSTPKQEMFAKRLSEYVNVRFIITQRVYGPLSS